MATFGEAQVGYWPYTDLIPVPNNVSFSVVSSPVLEAGTYFCSGAYYVKAASGITLTTYHADIGLDPSSIDHAPAGGSSNGHHVPIPGDDSGALTYVEPTGSRLLTLDGNSRIYLHLISSYTPANATVKAGGILNWHKVA